MKNEKMNWNKVKIPSFGMSDAMVKFKNGTFGNAENDGWDWDIKTPAGKDKSAKPGKR